MRPTNLDIYNYRAFEEAHVPLGQIEAAAIVGPNGAGKSTIPEAMLWALFGDGRSSSVDGVVRLGADEAAVQLEYEHGGNTYRIVRKRSRGRRSDLQYLIQDDGDWKPLSGASIRETQDKVNRDLAMEQSLFVNSSFVVQGQSAGICEATPAERKAVLYKVIEDRLARFGPLHEAAKARVKQIDTEVAAKQAERIMLAARVTVKDDTLASRKAAEIESERLRVEIESLDTQLAELRELAAREKADREKIDDLQRRMDALTKEITSLNGQAENNDRIVSAAERLLSNADDIRDKCLEADKLELELSGYQSAERELSALQADRKQKQSELDREGDRLGSEERRLTDTRALAVKRREDLLRRAALVDTVPCNTEAPALGATCPLLTDAHKAVADADTLVAEIDDLDAKLREISEQITAHTTRYKAEIDPISDKILGVAYNKDVHQKAEERFAQIKAARTILPDLASAESRSSAAAEAAASAREQVGEKIAERNRIDSEHRALANRVVEVGLSTLDVAEQSLRTKQQQAEDCVRTIARDDERIAQITEAEEALTSIDDALSVFSADRIVCATLKQAFSPDGIPALIIDAAVPEIEGHANEILSQLSDGRMSLELITQKANVTGGIAETLDIIVTDSLGERPYEDYSGGERLRVDLAVRIALGQALAQRTGSRIKTLVLDEVCSPLDEAGEEALLDCINRLQSVFDCILLITHRDSIKDRLPQQIEVTRNESGSQVRLVV